MKQMKAQFWSFDAIFAIAIFVTAVTVISFAWLTLSTQLGISSQNTALIMQLQQQSLMRTLVSPGYPSNWQSMVNLTNTSSWSSVSVGLGSSPASSTLSSGKVYALMADGEQELHQLSGDQDPAEHRI